MNAQTIETHFIKEIPKREVKKRILIRYDSHETKNSYKGS